MQDPKRRLTQPDPIVLQNERFFSDKHVFTIKNRKTTKILENKSDLSKIIGYLLILAALLKDELALGVS